MAEQSSTAAEHAPALIRAELLISYVLRYGVILCGVVIAVGLALLLLHPAGGSSSGFLAQVRSSAGGSPEAVPTTLAAFATGLAAFDPNTLISLGLLLLIALPVVRVALTVVIFLIQKDLSYFIITLIVLTVLLSGIFLGKAL